MSSDSFDSLDLGWVGIRVLLPFAFERGPGNAVAPGILDALGELKLRDHGVWEAAEPAEMYVDEALEAVKDAVFPKGGRRYWRVKAPVLDLIVQPRAFVDFGRGERLRVGACRPFGIELFLSESGFGVLSIALEADPTAHEGDPHKSPGAAAVLMIYRLSQMHARKLAKIRNPHPRDDPAKLQKMSPAAIDQIGAPPDENAPLEQRLGVRGGAVALPELARFLLPFDVTPFQAALEPREGASRPAFGAGQFNLYSVVRVGQSPEHSLVTHPQQVALGRLLVGIAQLQEPQHAGNDIETAGHVEQQMLNRHHQAACTSLAAAHLVLDQPGDPDWNVQGPQHYLSKYFIPSLLAHQQRRQSELIAAESRKAVQLLVSAGADGEKRVSEIAREMLQFELSAAFSTVSSRHVVNVWYELCRNGERAEKGLSQAREAVARLDATLAASASKENLDSIAHVQRNVEWIEIFIIAVYAMEAAKHLSDAWFDDNQVVEKWSLIVLPVASAVIAFSILQPHQRKAAHSHPLRQLVLLGSLAALFLLWFLFAAWLPG